MPDVATEDASFLQHLLDSHAERHQTLGRQVDTKKFARSVTPTALERVREYLTGDPQAQAENEYRRIMRTPVAWAHFVHKVAETTGTPPGPQAHQMVLDDYHRCQEDPIGQAHQKLQYAEMRAKLGGAYGMPGTGDRIAAATWAQLTEVVLEDPKLPGLAAAITQAGPQR